ncbi:MAG: Phosphoenolpyruvate synthase [Candidatus Woesebacteria bacterium GW2011_GWB1_38_8]|uniref:Phosphoenolpyruvate synthase n=1 Tax=Candidatus Woesebacteria bacterium GW2011_GWB1_38_8 TaxID=1618570 RepID=A0A0G0L2U6_9BACT|nr:MAG: Phosphoenolpyruvate synthase [Candidatus Woesebacteria bacterium GW2011_GWB1_38_8]
MKNKNDQRGIIKSTSLQEWSKLTNKYFGRKLRVEERKDRGAIYALLKTMGVPYERYYSFSSGDEITEDQFFIAVGDLGLPFWISATPKLGINDLNRMAKLRIENSHEGWKFIRELPRLKDYKIIVMQYADDPEFKGSACVSDNLVGIVDFVKGDKHPQLIAGLTLTDPMLFDEQRIIRYSKLLDEEYQEEVYGYVSKHPGHYEFQYGFLDGKKCLSFFDYNDEPAYEDIDDLFKDLMIYLNGDTSVKVDDGVIVKGLPACLGKAEGIARVIMSSEHYRFANLQKGEILISDATVPEMTPIMKNASAIVTDLGGITSHAAIVCREMNIPCIVGTKTATEKISEGMKIEVDAYKGLVFVVEP